MRKILNSIRLKLIRLLGGYNMNEIVSHQYKITPMQISRITAVVNLDTSIEQFSEEMEMWTKSRIAEQLGDRLMEENLIVFDKSYTREPNRMQVRGTIEVCNK